MNYSKSFTYGFASLSLKRSEELVAANLANATRPELKNNCEVKGQIANYQIFKTNDNQLKANALPVYFTTNDQSVCIPTGSLYLVFQNNISKKEQNAFLKKRKLKVEERISSGEFMVKTKENPIDLTIELQQEKTILDIVEPDLWSSSQTHAFALPTDELFEKQWYLDNKGIDPHGNQHWKYRKGADAGVVEAWKILYEKTGKIGSEDITVAVIDKGFDLSHPDFQGKIVAERDFYFESSSFVEKAFEIKKGGVDSQGKIDTEADHGTSCAGIAIGATNGSGIVGAAPNAKFMPIRYHVANGRYFRKMFRHITANGGDVISCSFGNVGIPMDRQSIKEIHKCATQGRNGKGCVILFATGNAFTFLQGFELATHPDIIAVGATTSEDTHAPYSNRTTNMSVVAPGGYGHTGTMTTSDVGYLDKLLNGQREQAGKGEADNPYYRFNAEGTSFACPLVAGVAALVLSANPNLTAHEVKSILETTADKIGSASDYNEDGHSPKYGYGRVNAANAVRKAFGMPTQPKDMRPADVSYVPELEFDYGTTLKGTHGPNDMEVVIQYPIHPDDAGKTLLAEFEVPIGHDEKKEFEFYIQKDRKPVFFPEDFIDKKLGLTPTLQISNIKPGLYYFMIRCLDKTKWEFIKGGGDFEINITLLPPMA